MDWPAWIASTARVAKGKSQKPQTPGEQLHCLFNALNIALVLDVGANHGQYAKSIRRHGYRGKIHSFEPLPDLQERLCQDADTDALWTIAPPFVLSDHEGTVTFHRSAEDDMSSVLPQAQIQKQISPSSRPVERLKLPAKRLDTLFENLAAPTHLKLDVQGFETVVLDGAANLLPQFRSIQLEMAMVQLYEGELDWKAMHDRMVHAGFELWLILPGYFERKIARQLQFDGVFVNKRTSSPGSFDLHHQPSNRNTG